jgi:hypothetical protein
MASILELLLIESPVKLTPFHAGAKIRAMYNTSKKIVYAVNLGRLNRVHEEFILSCSIRLLSDFISYKYFRLIFSWVERYHLLMKTRLLLMN